MATTCSAKELVIPQELAWRLADFADEVAEISDPALPLHARAVGLAASVRACDAARHAARQAEAEQVLAELF